MSTVEYQVSGMTCSHCERAVAEEVRRLDGVADVRVDAASGRLSIVSDPAVADEQVLAAVNEAGYSAARRG